MWVGPVNSCQPRFKSSSTMKNNFFILTFWKFSLYKLYRWLNAQRYWYWFEFSCLHRSLCSPIIEGAFMLPGYLLGLSYLQIPLCDNLFDLNHYVCLDHCAGWLLGGPLCCLWLGVYRQHRPLCCLIFSLNYPTSAETTVQSGAC